MAQSASRSKPSLNGLGTCSVAIVIASHFVAYGPGREGRFLFVTEIRQTRKESRASGAGSREPD